MKSAIIESGINGDINIPGDKSISHRSIIIPSISQGVSEISNILKSDDVINTMNAFKSMGVNIKENGNKIIIIGKGLGSLKKPKKEIYLGNSGTSARLLIGLLSSQKFNSILTGDESLSSRPMTRISNLLRIMGANIEETNKSLPVFIKGNELNKAEINVKIPSAQIKSGLILASLNTEGTTKIIEENITRNHTEIMLESFGANIEVTKKNNLNIISVVGKKELTSKNISVPSDLSSASFFIIAALINNNSKILLKNININPTRVGILIALEKMNANINIKNKMYLNNELIADIEVLSSKLNGCDLSAEMAKLMIDEYPILSVAAAFANSKSIFRGLGELRVKESDRLELIRKNLVNCGVNTRIEGDDLIIHPSKKYIVKDPKIITNFDHRIAMSFIIMGTKIGPLEIGQADCINTSFPTFISEFSKSGGNIF